MSKFWTGLVVIGAVAMVTALSARPSAAHSVPSNVHPGWRAQMGSGPPVEPKPRRAWVESAGAPVPPATPAAACGPGSHPKAGLQGRVAEDDPPAERLRGYTCNVEILGHQGLSGGYKVERFVDHAGHECGFYDTTLLFPSNATNLGSEPTGVAVLDMSDPRKPVLTDTLQTPAMQSPHESLVLNQKRGLLAAVMGNFLAYPGVIDIYDFNADCRHPALKSSLPSGILGHESGFAPDGRTFYAASLATGNLTAVDVSNPALPVTLWTGQYDSHGLSLSDDGNTAYVSSSPGWPRTQTNVLPEDFAGLAVLDVSQINARVLNPQVRVIGLLSWPQVTVPQAALPVTIGGHPYVVEVDEFSMDDTGALVGNGDHVGAARIVDIADPAKPTVVSNIRLAVHQPENRAAIANDPGAGSQTQGYAAHYCAVPQRQDPGIVVCSMINSGLRVFDIHDPFHPVEIAYYLTPMAAGGSNYAMSSPSFVPSRDEIWYSDANSGFYSLRLTNHVWVHPSAAGAVRVPQPARAAPRVLARDTIPRTGADAPLGLSAALTSVVLLARRSRRRSNPSVDLDPAAISREEPSPSRSHAGLTSHVKGRS